MNWNILVISGINTNKYFVCTGEGKRNNYNLNYKAFKSIYKNKKI